MNNDNYKYGSLKKLLENEMSKHEGILEENPNNEKSKAVLDAYNKVYRLCVKRNRF